MTRLTFSGLQVDYGGAVALRDVGGTVPEGKITVIVGPNGCGKSTLLRCLGGLLQPSVGEVRVGDEKLSSLRPRQLARLISTLPQSPMAPPGLSVFDLVARGRDPYRSWWNQWSAGDTEIIESTLADTGLSPLSARPLDSLSGGQRQRAWIALTLAQKTATVLLDEPTSFLDVAHQLEVLDLVLRTNRDQGITVCMVLHDLGLASRYADHLLVLADGGVAAEGAPSDVLTTETVRRIFGVESVLVDAAGDGRPFVIPIALSSPNPGPREHRAPWPGRRAP